MHEEYKNKKLTLVILTYERPEYIDICLRSIENQSNKDFDLIIIDNGSKKSYSKVLDKYKKLKPKYIKQPKNIGVIKNFNYALNLNIKTDYLMLFHDDDIMEKTLIEKSINILDENDDTVWVGSLGKSFEKKINFNKNTKIKFSKFNTGQLSMGLFIYPIHHGTIMYRFKKIKGIDYELLGKKYGILCDRPFLIETMKKSYCAIIKNELAGYRIHKNQDSRVTDYSEQNLLELHKCIKSNIKSSISLLIYFCFFSAFNLIEGHKRLNNPKNFKEFILKAREIKLILSPYMLFYFLGKIFYYLKIKLN